MCSFLWKLDRCLGSASEKYWVYVTADNYSMVRDLAIVNCRLAPVVLARRYFLEIKYDKCRP